MLVILDESHNYRQSPQTIDNKRFERNKPRHTSDYRKVVTACYAPVSTLPHTPSHTNSARTEQRQPTRYKRSSINHLQKNASVGWQKKTHRRGVWSYIAISPLAQYKEALNRIAERLKGDPVEGDGYWKPGSSLWFGIWKFGCGVGKRVWKNERRALFDKDL